jgi:NAD(P)-dependent dehydrogenase (short-subunit alcohol dehydrogenase family)
MTSAHARQPPEGTSFSDFWWSARNPPPQPTIPLSNKIVLITGANAGLGFEAAQKLAQLSPSKLILGVRSLEKGKEAKMRIQRATGVSENIIDVLELDMGNYASIERFAHEINDKYTTMDAAILNAGVAPPTFRESKEGWENAIQINVLSSAYLGILLLPKLRHTGILKNRAVHLQFVVSNGHRDISLDRFSGPASILDTVNDPKNFNFTKQYSISKLLEVWAYTKIAEKVDPEEVIVVGSCPSLTKTSLGRDFGLAIRAADALVKALIARTAEEGSRVLVSALGVGQEAHGGFFSHDRIIS